MASPATSCGLLDDAAQAVRGGRSVVVDASFSRAAQRAPFAELAGSVGVPFLVVETSTPEETIRARMAHRARDSHEASDADVGVYLSMREIYEPPSELEDRHVLHAQTQTGEPDEETTAQAIDKLVGQALS